MSAKTIDINDTTPPLDPLRERIAQFPKAPGVYLMKDAHGRVLYVGKAKDLRARVSSYFQNSADLLSTRGPEIAKMAAMVTDVDFLECDTEVDALLQESRLIKDIQPPFNERLKDDKTFPYLEITTGDDFPGVFVTRKPRLKGSKLFGPFTSAAGLRDAVNALQKVFKFRTCELDIRADDDTRRYFRPCLLYAINQCTAPCADRIAREDYRRDIDRLKRFMNSKRSVVLREMEKEMKTAADALNFEEAARVRDRIKAIQNLKLSGDVAEDVQPEVFYVDPAQGLERLAKILDLETPPRIIEGIDIANLQGEESVGSLVCFIDGRPFKGGYKRFRIKNNAGASILSRTHSPDESLRPNDSAGARIPTRTHFEDESLRLNDSAGATIPPALDGAQRGQGSRTDSHDESLRPTEQSEDSPYLAHIPSDPDAAQPPQPPSTYMRDDYAMIREVVQRRYRRAGEAEELFPDVILIDGGLGQLHAALEACGEMFVKPPMVISLAKREEELYRQARQRPIKLPRNDPALRLLQQVRDEAHRFAQHYHHILRSKRQFDEDIKAGKRPPRRRRAASVSGGPGPLNSGPSDSIDSIDSDPVPPDEIQAHPQVE